MNGGSGRAASSVGSNTNGSSVKISPKRFFSKDPNFLGLANSKGAGAISFVLAGRDGRVLTFAFFSSLAFQNSDRALSHLSRSFPSVMTYGVAAIIMYRDSSH